MCRGELKSFGQEQVLKYWDELDEAGQKQLAGQLEAIDFAALDRLIREYVLNKPEIVIPGDLAPAGYVRRVPRSGAEAERLHRADALGRELLKQGKVAALTVAGGQGTRLGFDGPKGTYPIGPMTGRTLFAYFAETIARAGKKYGKTPVWYIMTSVLNDGATQAFFKKNDYFGLKPENVVFFVQGTMPAIGYDGKLLLESKSSLALSPDGHGGTLLALRRSGALERMKRDGVEHISYFQVDNPLAPIVNERFIGLHALENAEMSAIMLPKTNAFEKLGNFCVSQGRLRIIEYSDLPENLATATAPDGSLRFIAGSPAIHVIARSFVEKLTAGGDLKLPWHRADKKVGCLDAEGRFVKPETPNAVKLESFIFDALPLAEHTLVFEGERAELFAPTKNKTGVDSVESCRAMLIERDAGRLERAGVAVPRRADGSADCLIEIAPSAAIDDGDVAALVRLRRITAIQPGGKLLLE